MIHFGEADIRAQLGAASTSLGERYASEGRVKLEPPLPQGDSLFLRAEVRGSRASPYSTRVRVRQLRQRVIFDSQCSCPMASQCKHVAAVLLYHLATQDPASAQRMDSARRARERTLIDLWLLQLAQGDSAPPPKEELHLLLGRQSFRNSWGSPWELTLMKAARLKNGSLSQFKVVRSPDISKLRDLYPLLAPVLTLFAGEQRAQGGYGGSLALQGVGGMVVLHAAINSGHCHLDDLGQPALQLANARSAKPRWREQDDGSQQLTVGEPHWLLLPLEPLHAIDPLANQCFALDTQLPGLNAAALARAPLIPPDLADDVADSVASQVPRLPLPRSRLTAARQDLLPEPLLLITGLDPAQPHLEGAILHFVYGQQRVNGDDNGQLLSLGQGQSALRHKALEAQYRQLLEQQLNTFLLPGSTPERPLHGYGDSDLRRWLAWRETQLPQLQAAGWLVEFDQQRALELVDDPQISAQLDETRQGGWFDFALGVEIDGQRHELLPMLLAAINAGTLEGQSHYLLDLPKSDGRRRLVRIPAERLATMVTTLQELADGRSHSRSQLKVSTLNAWALLQSQQLNWQLPRLNGLLRQLQQLDQQPPLPTPAGFLAELRPYQALGLARLQWWREQQLNGVLADDMGLGKTLQTLAHIQCEKNSGRLTQPALIVAPTSVVGNWRAEARRFAPELKLLLLHGSDRHRHFHQIKDADLVITSYPLLLRDVKRYSDTPFHLLVLDEAQVVKNRRAKVAEAVRLVRCRHRLCLSGTPMENHLGELWSLFDFLMPGLLGEQQRFARLYRVPIEKAGDSERATLLARRIAPFLLRRTKAEVVSELPPKSEILRTIELEGSQRDLYETVRVAVSDEVQGAIQRLGQGRSQIQILDALLKLRQVCCDPRLVKLDAARKVQHSAKLAYLNELLPTLIAEGRRILLFSQFVEMLGLIAAELDAMNIPYLKLTGSSRNREQLVERFQRGEVPLFLISLKAGGVGLNLTAADTVIHYDPWWNPAVENQATDRAHRIGQDKPVFVYKLVTAGTVEEQIMAMQARKQALADGIHSAAGDLARLDDHELLALLQPIAEA